MVFIILNTCIVLGNLLALSQIPNSQFMEGLGQIAESTLASSLGRKIYEVTVPNSLI